MNIKRGKNPKCYLEQELVSSPRRGLQMINNMWNWIKTRFKSNPHLSLSLSLSHSPISSEGEMEPSCCRLWDSYFQGWQHFWQAIVSYNDRVEAFSILLPTRLLVHHILIRLNKLPGHGHWCFGSYSAFGQYFFSIFPDIVLLPPAGKSKTLFHSVCLSPSLWSFSEANKNKWRF